jgi:hypothetical protein
VEVDNVMMIPIVGHIMAVCRLVRRVILMEALVEALRVLMEVVQWSIMRVVSEAHRVAQAWVSQDMRTDTVVPVVYIQVEQAIPTTVVVVVAATLEVEVEMVNMLSLAEVEEVPATLVAVFLTIPHIQPWPRMEVR